MCVCSSALLFCFSIPVSATAAETKKITFGYSTIGAMATGVWMAKEIGAFDKYGIQADLIHISSGPVVVQALIGGDLHGGSGQQCRHQCHLEWGSDYRCGRRPPTGPITGSSSSRKSTVSRISRGKLWELPDSVPLQIT